MDTGELEKSLATIMASQALGGYKNRSDIRPTYSHALTVNSQTMDPYLQDKNVQPT